MSDAAAENQSQGTENQSAAAPGDSLLAGSTPQVEEQQAQAEEVKTDAPAGAPEAYEFAAPEGREFDGQIIGVFSEVAKELNLPQDKAQMVLDKVAPVIEQRQLERIAEVQSKWREATLSDKEFGGDKLAENLAFGKKALERFGSPEFNDLLNQSGIGNHPEMIRFAIKAGRAIGEDGFVGGKAPQSGKSVTEVLYDNSQK